MKKKIEVYVCDECDKLLINDIFIEYKGKHHFCCSTCMMDHLIKIGHVEKIDGGKIYRCDFCDLDNVNPIFKFQGELFCDHVCLHFHLVYHGMCENIDLEV